MSANIMEGRGQNRASLVVFNSPGEGLIPGSSGGEESLNVITRTRHLSGSSCPVGQPGQRPSKAGGGRKQPDWRHPNTRNDSAHCRQGTAGTFRLINYSFRQRE